MKRLKHVYDGSSGKVPRASALPHRRLGKSNLLLPSLGFGSAHLGELFTRVNENQARSTLRAAWAAGIRYFDTAPWYGHGLAERRVGNSLLERGDDGYVLSTKVGRVYHKPNGPHFSSTSPWTGGLRFQLRFDYSYEGVMRSYEDSLHRLGVNRIDALVVHDLDASYHSDPNVLKGHWKDLTDSGMRALQELKRNGDIKAVGAGINGREMMSRMATALDLDFLLVAMPYTLLDQGALDEGLPSCAARGVGVVIGSPFASGILATGARAGAYYDYAPATEEILSKTARIEKVCLAHKVSLAAAALQFPLGHPLVASVIPGAVSASHVESNVADFLSPIDASFWADLKSEGLIRSDSPTQS